MFAYCLNNPVMMRDDTGQYSCFLTLLYEDIKAFDRDNTDVETVYQSHFFSAYQGTFVLRHNISFLSSFAIGGVIFLQHDHDNSEYSTKFNELNHEYGHILQERDYGKIKYFKDVALPSVSFNILSRIFPQLKPYYFKTPWESDADVRGGVVRFVSPREMGGYTIENERVGL